MSQVSRNLHAVRVIKHVSIPMSDGAWLAADIFLPDATGTFPAVFDYYPYRKDDTMAASLRQHRYLAQRGYVAIRLDVRGTGGSGGIALDEYVLQEQLDAVDAIRWMSEQPWCNGNVGMFGLSYGGFNSLQVAMHRPPALKAICPMYFTDNRFTDDCHYKGGALQMLFDMGSYGLFMVVLNSLPPYPQCVGEQWATMWEERLKNEPWILHWLENQTYNGYWKHGSLCEDYQSIQCAVYLFGGWRDGYTNCNLRVFEHLRCAKKLLIGPWLHVLPDVGVPGPPIDHLHEMVRFYDYWLKGIDNGIMEEPPITVYVQKFDVPRGTRTRTSGFWRHETGWPLEHASEKPLYLASGGTLLTECPEEQGIQEYQYNPTAGTTYGIFSGSSPYVLPVDQRLEDAYSMNWTSEPLTEVVEILGYPKLILHLTCSADIATVVARLIDVAPDGIAALVCKGVLNLTHRESHELPSPIIPGQPYEVLVPLDATSWMFEPGHHIRVALSGADFPNVWPSPKPYTAKAHWGAGTASQLILPVVRPQDPILPAPKLNPPMPMEATAEVQLEQPVWRVSRDHINEKTEVFMRTAHRAKVGDHVEFQRGNEMHATASERDPAQASIRGLSWATLQWPGRTIDARARGQIESTATALHVTIQLTITMDDMEHFQKRWARTIPRLLL